MRLRILLVILISVIAATLGVSVRKGRDVEKVELVVYICARCRHTENTNKKYVENKEGRLLIWQHHAR